MRFIPAVSPVQIQVPLPYSHGVGLHPVGTLQIIWPVGQVVKTRPFHGCNMGSNPVRVTIPPSRREQQFGGLAQLVRAPASHAGGREFESPSLHQASPRALQLWGLLFSIQQHNNRKPLDAGKNCARIEAGHTAESCIGVWDSRRRPLLRKLDTHYLRLAADRELQPNE